MRQIVGPARVATPVPPQDRGERPAKIRSLRTRVYPRRAKLSYVAARNVKICFSKSAAQVTGRTGDVYGEVVG